MLADRRLGKRKDLDDPPADTGINRKQVPDDLHPRGMPEGPADAGEYLVVKGVGHSGAVMNSGILRMHGVVFPVMNRLSSIYDK